MFSSSPVGSQPYCLSHGAAMREWKIGAAVSFDFCAPHSSGSAHRSREQRVEFVHASSEPRLWKR